MPMNVLARATSGLALVASFFRTFEPSFSATANLPAQLIQPPTGAPTGTFSKSWRYGNVGATRTRATPVKLPSFATTVPCWAGTSLATVSLPFLTTPRRGGGFRSVIGGGGGAGSDHA